MKKMPAILLLILSLIGTLTACGGTNNVQRQYNMALDLWNSDKQYEAIQIFTKNPTYKNSWDYIKKFYHTTGERIKSSVDRTVGLRANGTVLDTMSDYVVSEWRDIVQIVSGISFVAGLTENGYVTFLQEDYWDHNVISSGYIADWYNIKSITSNGVFGIVGLTHDGSVLMTGRNDLGRFDLSQLSGATSITDSSNLLVGVMPDGTVVSTGDTLRGDVSDWTDIIEISAQDYDIVGLKTDGTVVTTGYTESVEQKVSDWSDIVSVCADGSGNIIGLKSNGTVITTRDEWDLSDWTDVVSITASSEKIVALRSDGTVLTKGFLPGGLEAVSEWTDIVAINAAADHLVGLKADGTLVATGKNDYGQCNLSTWKLFDDVNELFAPSFADQLQDEAGEFDVDTPASNFEIKIDEYGNAEIIGYVANAETLTIPSEIDGHPVTAISGFSDRPNLVNVVVSNGITAIGDNAFKDCENLENITIPDSVTSIGAYAFAGCSNLMLADIPTNLKQIGSSAFDGCANLMAATIPAGVNRIEEWTFRNCVNLASVTIPNSVTLIGHSAFENCASLTSVVIPDSVTSIGLYAFEGCASLTDLVLSNSIPGIEDATFSGCSSLSRVIIPDNITYIGSCAFSNCTSLTDVYLPNGVGAGSHLGICVFRDCPNLTNLYIEDPKIYFDLNSCRAFEGCGDISVICNGVKYTWDSEYVMRDSNGDPLEYDPEPNAAVLPEHSTGEETPMVQYSDLSDLGRTFKELEEKYGGVSETIYWDGFEYYKFQNEPRIAFWFDGTQEGVLDDAKCGTLLATAEVLFDDFDHAIEVDTLQKLLDIDDMYTDYVSEYGHIGGAVGAAGWSSDTNGGILVTVYMSEHEKIRPQDVVTIHDAYP